MFNYFRQYIVVLYNVPSVVYEGLVSMLCIGAVLILAFIGFRRSLKYIAGLLLTEYVFLLFYMTVFYRESSACISGHNFHPFWSYAVIRQGNDFLFVENIMNTVAFIPVGFLLSPCMRCKKENINWTSGWLFALFVGLCISVSIEALQYFNHRGFSEFDDVFHNTLGTLIGYGLWIVVNVFIIKVKNNSLYV